MPILEIELKESEIEFQICRYYDLMKIEVFKIPSAGYFDVGKKVFRKHVNPYVRNGVADLYIPLRGGAYEWQEVKTRSGKQTDAQKEFEAVIQKKGGIYRIVRSVEDAIALVPYWKEKGLC